VNPDEHQEVSMRRTTLTLTLAALLGLTLAAPARAATELKIATVAPNGSAWMRIFNKMKARIKKETGGAVKIKFYPGQVQGDERDVVRKMRTGQLEGGSFTTVGLSQINNDVLVLQVPMIFETYEQLDKVRKALSKEFEKSFRDKGYELLGWGDVGWVYLFSKHPVKNLPDLKKRKVWAWGDDPLTKAMMREAGISPRLLGLPQVYPALNTGMVDTVYNSPLACLTLQWHTKVKYYSDFPLAIAIGATVVTKKAFDKLSPEHQKMVKKVAQAYHKALNKRIRRDNEQALKALEKQGIKPVAVSNKGKKQFRDIAMKVGRKFVGRYYSKGLFQKVLKNR
jgi:TRAP-type C4-dicarboxylate transport system substrate-binding protein